MNLMNLQSFVHVQLTIINSKSEKSAITIEKQNWLLLYAANEKNLPQTTKLSSKSQSGTFQIKEPTMQWVSLFIWTSSSLPPHHQK